MQEKCLWDEMDRLGITQREGKNFILVDVSAHVSGSSAHLDDFMEIDLGVSLSTECAGRGICFDVGNFLVGCRHDEYTDEYHRAIRQVWDCAWDDKICAYGALFTGTGVFDRCFWLNAWCLSNDGHSFGISVPCITAFSGDLCSSALSVSLDFNPAKPVWDIMTYACSGEYVGAPFAYHYRVMPCEGIILPGGVNVTGLKPGDIVYTDNIKFVISEDALDLPACRLKDCSIV